jgi:hypothetical protein
MRLQTPLVMGLVTFLCAATSSMASGDPATPPLNAAQQAKLTKIQAQFVPGGKSNVSGYGFGKLSEFCGANIPMEIHPSMVALEKMKGDDRTDIDSTCQGFANSVVYLCGDRPDADPVVKEMIRSSVKKMVCRATSSTSDLNNHGLKYTLESGTLTLTVGAKDGAIGGSSISEDGDKFLKANVRRGPDGLSIGGQQLKRKMIDDLSIGKSSLRKRLKDECAIDISVAIDDKLAEHYSKHLGDAPTAACDAGLQVAYNNCRSSADTEISSQAIKAGLKKNLKGISCVLSDNESIAIRPNGILELGFSNNAPRPKFQDRTMMSMESYYFNWLKANIGSLGSGTQPPSAAPAAPAARAKTR